MIDFGTEDPEVAAIFERALAVIGCSVGKGWADYLQAREDILGSELARLNEEISRGPIDISGVIDVGLETACLCMEQIRYLAQNSVPTSPLVLQVLLRAALVSSARTLFVLLPNEPETRLERARQVSARDAESGGQGLRQFADFEEFAAFAVPNDAVAEIDRQRQELWPKGKPPGDGRIVTEMTTAMYEALVQAGKAEELGHGLLREHVTWMWHTYSGIAHGHLWPRFLAGISEDRRVPGDLPLDIYMVATLTHMALLSALSRLEPGSALTTKPVRAE